MYVLKEKFYRQEIVVKKSRFIASAFYVESENDVKEYIEKLRKEFYDAKHHVYAYIMDNKEKMSDDGEPSGTGGKQLLNIIKNKNINNCLIVVSRIFGGILLGTGGLSHAYQDSAKLVIDNATLSTLIDGYKISIKFAYEFLSKIKSNFSSFEKLIVDNIEYGDIIYMSININDEDKEKLVSQIKDITSGKVDFIDEEKIWYTI